LTGSEDFLTSRFQGRQLAQLIPRAEYREIPEASHGFVWEEPELFASLVTEFVERSAGEAPTTGDSIP
jgi:pimeloyl-ACP methyl ester carboxylesterase